MGGGSGGFTRPTGSTLLAYGAAPSGVRLCARATRKCRAPERLAPGRSRGRRDALPDAALGGECHMGCRSGARRSARRSLENPEERAYYIVFSPQGACFAGGDSPSGGAQVDDRDRLPGRQAGGGAGSVRGAEVECVVPVHHPGLFAHTFLAVQRARAEKGAQWQQYTGANPAHRARSATALLGLYLRPSAPVDQVLAWSRWRRKHQARARLHHHQTRAKRGSDNVQL